MNDEWALGELQQFRDLLGYRDKPGLYAATYVGSDDDIAAQRTVVERICAKVIGPKPAVPVDGSDPYRTDREWAIRCMETIKRDAEIRRNLGDDAPVLNAGSMHSWVWEGARSLWQSGHFAEAVEGAAKKVNAETQNKAGRRDVSETDLFNQAFSETPRSRVSRGSACRTTTTARRREASDAASGRSRKAASQRSGTRLHTTEAT